MAACKVYFSYTFNEKLSKCEKSFRIWVQKIINQFCNNPSVGKPLGSKWLREKKFGKQRIYFLVYEEFGIVYLVDMSEKKNQQNTIESIKAKFGIYRQEIEQIAKEHTFSEP